MKILAAGSAVYGLRAAIAACSDPARVEAKTDHGHFIHGFVVNGSCDADIVIIPADMLEDLDRRGLVDGLQRRIGFTGIAACVRAGRAVPDIGDGASLRDAVRAAAAVFLTTAPTGDHMLASLRDIGLGTDIEPKLKRFDRATEMLESLAASKDNALAFGPTTELLAWRDKGIAYGGSVPGAFDLPLAYDAAVLASSNQKSDARDLLDILAGPAGLAHFRASGVN